VDAFIEGFVLNRGAVRTCTSAAGIWHHLSSWYPHRADPNMLWLHYDDLIEVKAEGLE